MIYNANSDGNSAPDRAERPEFASVADGLRRLGTTRAEWVAVVRSTNDSRESHREFLSGKEQLRAAGIWFEGDELERLLLTYAVQGITPAGGIIARAWTSENTHAKRDAGVHEPWLRDPTVVRDQRDCDGLQNRDPAQICVWSAVDWVISGIPRSWIPRIPLHKMPQALLYIAKQFRGLKPAFYIHVAPAPRNRSLVIPKEVRKAYYRMARSLELQPQMKGILCASWFHDPVMLRETPHHPRSTNRTWSMVDAS